jgi:hypothetical protein
MTSSPPTLSGFNNNVRYRGMRFHIQTEDSGITRPHITTHLFADGGYVIKSMRTDYAEYVGHPERAILVHRMMREQHRAVALELRDGKLDATIERIAPGLPPVDLALASASGATSAPSASGTRPLVTTADVAALVPPTQPPPGADEALSAEAPVASERTEPDSDPTQSADSGGSASVDPVANSHRSPSGAPSSSPSASSQPPSSRGTGSKRRGSSTSSSTKQPSTKQPSDHAAAGAGVPPSSRRSASRRAIADREVPESSQRPSSRRAANGANERPASSRKPASAARPASNRKPTALARAASRHANGGAEKPASSKNGSVAHASSGTSRRPASNDAATQRPPSSTKSNGTAHPPSSRNAASNRAPSSRKPGNSARPPSSRGASANGSKRPPAALAPSKPPSSRGARRAGRPSAVIPVQPDGPSLFGPMPQDSLDDAILTYVARAKNAPPSRGSK